MAVHEHMKKAADMLTPLNVDLIKMGMSHRIIPSVLQDAVASYLFGAESNLIIRHLPFLEYFAAFLYLNKTVPIWLVYLPQVRNNAIEPKWQTFHEHFQKACQKLQVLSPTPYRKLYRGLHDTQVFDDVHENTTLAINAPASCTQVKAFAESFMHADNEEAGLLPDGEFFVSWQNPGLPTKGDVLMQIWDIQDSNNITKIWHDPFFENLGTLARMQDMEHLIPKDTQVKILLKEKAIHPGSKRPVTFIVAQDTRSSNMGSSPNLVNALDLAKSP